MTSLEFQERLTDRAQRAGVALPGAVIDALEAYYRLLSKWNAKINLTALPLDQPTGETFDRLFVEPLAAARRIQNRPDNWLDLGSGGGSPAIPLKIVMPSPILTMIESKGRKAAFLREAVRTLALSSTAVVVARFEEYARWPEAASSADIVTVRAVRADRTLFDVAARLLAPKGRLLLFGPTASPVAAEGFCHVETEALTESPSYLVIYERAFHVERERSVPRGT